MLLTRDIKPSSQYQTINDFQKEFVDTKVIDFDGNFKELVLSINKNEPTESFAASFLSDSLRFLETMAAYPFRKRSSREGC